MEWQAPFSRARPATSAKRCIGQGPHLQRFKSQSCSIHAWKAVRSCWPPAVLQCTSRAFRSLPAAVWWLTDCISRASRAPAGSCKGVGGQLVST